MDPTRLVAVFFGVLLLGGCYADNGHPRNEEGNCYRCRYPDRKGFCREICKMHKAESGHCDALNSFCYCEGMEEKNFSIKNVESRNEYF
uniref:Putative Sodium channel toxin n=1 Tax=Megacormus gertschi TaxID=1843536 RepID=A0A224XF48_9SCOR